MKAVPEVSKSRPRRRRWRRPSLFGEAKRSYQLSQACLGREDHAAKVSVSATIEPRSGETTFEWHDEFTGQSGPLGTVSYPESGPAVKALFTQLRAWRESCESGGGRC